jgi:hypothetical protein
VTTAEQLFTTQGAEEDLPRRTRWTASIAKGSFCAFFDAKESLYLEVMIRRASPRGYPPHTPIRLTSRVWSSSCTPSPMCSSLIRCIDDFHPRRRTGRGHPARGAEQMARVIALVAPLPDYLATGQQAGVLREILPRYVRRRHSLDGAAYRTSRPVRPQRLTSSRRQYRHSGTRDAEMNILDKYARVAGMSDEA